MDGEICGKLCWQMLTFSVEEGKIDGSCSMHMINNKWVQSFM
jgi:hypothetical protein